MKRDSTSFVPFSMLLKCESGKHVGESVSFWNLIFVTARKA